MLDANAVAVPPFRVPSDVLKLHKLIDLATLSDEEMRRYASLRRSESLG
jgi:hypothetical protein